MKAGGATVTCERQFEELLIRWTRRGFRDEGLRE